MFLKKFHDDLRKKLLYRSKHRGSKETDIIFSRFADLYLSDMNSAELLEYDIILNQTDSDIMSWIMGVQVVPSEMPQNLVKKLLNLVKLNG